MAPTRHSGSPRLGKPWRLLLLALLAQCGISLVDQGLPLLTGFIKNDLEISAATAGLAVSSVAFGKVVGGYPTGVAADRFGERRVLVAGGAVAAALVALAALSPLALLFPLLFVAGIACATGTPAGGRLVVRAFPPERRGIALGIRQTAIPLGALIAAAVLPWIAHVAGWRWSIAAAAAGLALSLVPIATARLAADDDRIVAEIPRPSVRAWNRNVVLLTSWASLMVTGQYALLAFLPLDLEQRAGMALTEGALVVAVAIAAGLVGRVAWGVASDRLLEHGRKPVMVTVTAAGLVSAIALLVIPMTVPVVVIVALAAFAGVALMGYQGLVVVMVAEAAGGGRVGAATGFTATFGQLSIAVSPVLYGLVADASGSYRAIWAALAVVLTLAFLPVALVRERQP